MTTLINVLWQDDLNANEEVKRNSGKTCPNNASVP